MAEQTAATLPVPTGEELAVDLADEDATRRWMEAGTPCPPGKAGD